MIDSALPSKNRELLLQSSLLSVIQLNPNPSFAQKKPWVTYLALCSDDKDREVHNHGKDDNQEDKWREASVMDPYCRAEHQLLTVCSNPKENTKEKSSYNPGKMFVLFKADNLNATGFHL